jgi:hypothetical protein
MLEGSVAARLMDTVKSFYRPHRKHAPAGTFDVPTAAAFLSDEFPPAGRSVQVDSILLASTDPERLRSWYAAALEPEENAEVGGYRVLKFGGF